MRKIRRSHILIALTVAAVMAVALLVGCSFAGNRRNVDIPQSAPNVSTPQGATTAVPNISNDQDYGVGSGSGYCGNWGGRGGMRGYSSGCGNYYDGNNDGYCDNCGGLWGGGNGNGNNAAQNAGNAQGQGGNSGATAAQISLDQAKQIAADHAKLALAELNFSKARLDYDDGMAEYEIEFVYGSTEYEYEINAVTGNITSVDIDSIYD